MKRLLTTVVILALSTGVAAAQGLGLSPGGVSVGVTRTDRSGSITLGASAQALMPATPSRRGCVVQNNSNADLWVSELGAAAPLEPSWWLPPGAYWNCEAAGVPVTALSIYGSTTGQTFSAREW